MKKIISLIFLLSIASVNAIEKPYGMAGCGLGSVIIGKNDAQIIAATTNNLSTQTFSISSGTSNCSNINQKTAQIKNFIEANYESLVTEMAKGNGDTLLTLSSLYGCHTESFTKELKKNYSQVIPENENTTSIMKGISSIIKTNDELRKTCLYAI
ncbi:MAG: DUF3015 family protein [Bacteriovorax sp.]|jgi:hypothetical protein